MIMSTQGKRLRSLASSMAVLIVFGLIATATVSRAARTSASSITVVNNSTLAIRHIYLSPPDNDNWGPDQLNESSLATGGSFSLSDVSCSQGSIKVIAEDENGCFFYYTTACTADSTWTISSSSTPDCGN
jgi:hypothetical protein